MKFTTRKLAVLSMLAAISIVLIALSFPIPLFPPYLKYDFADISNSQSALLRLGRSPVS